MKVLSILWEHCSTAAVVIDGEVVATVSEERFTRRKNDEVYPRRAIEHVLAAASLSASDLDHVALAGERFDPKYILCHRSTRFSARDRLREQREYWYPRLYEGRDVSYLDVFADKLDVAQYPGNWDPVLAVLRNGNSAPDQFDRIMQAFRRDTACRHLGIGADKIVFPHHHRAHGCYVHYGSPMTKDRVVILTGDGWGDDMNASVSLAEGPEIQLLSASQNFGLVRMYRWLTLLLGMKPDEHEYKVMGLAPYARAEMIQEPLEVFRNTMYVEGLQFKYRDQPVDSYAYFRDRLEGYRFDAIAGALQQYTEEILVAWARNALRMTGARRLVFGGGVAMNIKAMMEIGKLPEVDDIFICPSPSDDSLPIGAAYVLEHDHATRSGRDPRATLRPLRDAYLGPDLDPAEVRTVVDGVSASGEYAVTADAAPARVAALIAAGRIVGRCVGRSEFGARALGNRSILADPRRLDVVRTVNEKVKCRDFWMPFAPSIVEHRSDDYLVNPKRLSAPYMTIGFETRPLAWQDLPAALHPADATCRPQIVTADANPSYHRLICEFERLTGVGAVMNTSFNIHGEPIVQTAADAVDVLRRSGLDALVLGDVLIEKR